MHQLIHQTNPQWHEILICAFNELSASYLEGVFAEKDWLPGRERMLAAFSEPLDKVHYILLGESPYPRRNSANGYAFWDNAVHDLWSEHGLSKTVNRATSLRNLIKMLLVARGDLGNDVSPTAIAALDKTHYWQTGAQFFRGMINQGFVLLNATLVYRENQVNTDARQWRPFLISVLNQLAEKKPDVGLILLGRIAAEVAQTRLPISLVSEHPYNLSFITNPDVLKFFKPMDLLCAHEIKNKVG